MYPRAHDIYVCIYSLYFIYNCRLAQSGGLVESGGAVALLRMEALDIAPRKFLSFNVAMFAF